MSSPASAEAELRALIAELTRERPERIDLSVAMERQGLDSLQLIILRERLETSLAVVFTDEEWMALDTPASVLARVRSQTGTAGSAASPWARADLEIGMPLTGRNNLAETPLLQYLGDQRWRHISEVMGVPSRDIVDEAGARLYATFYYVELAFPPDRPMASFGENDRLTVLSSMARYGTSMLDGISYLLPQGTDSVPFTTVQQAVDAGVPAARLSNIFVRQFVGAQWLKKGRPAHPHFSRIPALPDPPDSYEATKAAERSGTFEAAGPGWTPMTDGPVPCEYRLIPDRDLNGAGLVYFANYPMFLDICEREVLASGSVPLPHDLIDRRTVVRRRIAYLNNAASRDTLRIELEPLIRVDDSGLRLRVNARMFRRSDERLMMVSTVEKIVPAAAIEEVAPDFAMWRDRRDHLQAHDRTGR
jgi:probable biosynthetic protein (TIGR04098 family)